MPPPALIGGPAYTLLTGEDFAGERTVAGRYRVLAGVEVALQLSPALGVLRTANVARLPAASPAITLEASAISPAATSRTLSLTVLNAEFTPDARAVLSNLVRQQNARLAGNLSLGGQYLSRPELLAAQSRPWVARMAYGNAVERMVGDQIRSDPLLRSFLDPVGIKGRGPDVLGIGSAYGQTFDITTPAAAAEHLLRPYGAGLTIIEYQRPLSFTVFP